jgi:2-phospho-L-lactate guanylyltransferase
MTRQFALLVPVKPPSVGKSRLVGPSPDVRRSLAAAFALDTVSVARRTPGVEAVLAVTDDARFAAELVAVGAQVIPDGVTGDLNETLRQAAAEAARRWPDLIVVALCADLPALRTEDLAGALDQVGREGEDAAVFVADAEGIGTTLYAAPAGRFDPQLGLGSRDAHLARGARELDGDWPSLRRDVDDLETLASARALGLGHHTEPWAMLALAEEN